MSKDPETFQNIPYRINIGITGHRLLSDEQLVIHQLQGILEKQLYGIFNPHARKLLTSTKNTAVAFTALTPLAEGADRLVAREILKRPLANIQAVLPLMVEDYMEDFNSKESKSEFEMLLAKCRKPTVLSEKRLSDEFRPEQLKDARNKAYENAGHYIVDNCDVVIALWNGKPAKGPGGTAEIVDYARYRNRPLFILSTENNTVETENMGILSAEGLLGIERFNEKLQKQPTGSNYHNNVYADLFNHAQGEQMQLEAKDAVKKHLIPIYVTASRTAKSNQKLYHWAGFIIFACSAMAVISIAVAQVFEKLWLFKSAFIVEFILLTIILGIVSIGRKRRFHKNWIENRFLVERIRSAFFFVISDLELPSLKVPDFGYNFNPGYDWMIRTFEEVRSRLPVENGNDPDQWDTLRQYNLEYWIRHQLHFHTRTHHRLERFNLWFELAVWGIFIIAFAATGFHLIHHLELPLKPLDRALLSLAMILPAIVAAIEGIRAQREYERVESRSVMMVRALTNIEKNFLEAKTYETWKKLMYQTQQLIFWETKDWMVLIEGQDLKITV